MDWMICSVRSRPRTEFCEDAAEDRSFHGKLVIEIDIDQMLIEDLFFFGKDLTFPADELIGLCFQ